MWSLVKCVTWRAGLPVIVVGGNDVTHRVPVADSVRHLAEAVATLQKASMADAAQSEINEHLGDALYQSGRRYEARFAWRAALVTADDNVERQRIEAKIGFGWTSATAAP